MQARIVFSTAVALAALGLAAGAYASMSAGAPRMGPASTVRRPAFHGFYDGRRDTYVNTDVSDKKEAAMMHINYAPGLKAVPLTASPEIYLVQGKAAPDQLAIFGSEPGEADYSPIWKETILTWKASAKPVLITSDTQIDKLENKGELTERATSVRLNCPIIKVGKAA